MHDHTVSIGIIGSTENWTSTFHLRNFHVHRKCQPPVFQGYTLHVECRLLCWIFGNSIYMLNLICMWYPRMSIFRGTYMYFNIWSFLNFSEIVISVTNLHHLTFKILFIITFKVNEIEHNEFYPHYITSSVSYLYLYYHQYTMKIYEGAKTTHNGRRE